MESIRVEVVCALKHRQEVVRLVLADGTCVGDAIAASGLLGLLDCASGWSAARYGTVLPMDAVLRDGDRIDICRPLVTDPLEARRSRVRRRR